MTASSRKRTTLPAPHHRRWTVFIVTAVVLALVAAVTGVRRFFVRGDQRSADAPNVLLVTLDTTRADRIGAYGYALAKTPHLDRLAAEGVRFERTVAPAPITLPS